MVRMVHVSMENTMTKDKNSHKPYSSTWPYFTVSHPIKKLMALQLSGQIKTETVIILLYSMLANRLETRDI